MSNYLNENISIRIIINNKNFRFLNFYQRSDVTLNKIKQTIIDDNSNDQEIQMSYRCEITGVTLTVDNDNDLFNFIDIQSKNVPLHTYCSDALNITEEKTKYIGECIHYKKFGSCFFGKKCFYKHINTQYNKPKFSLICIGKKYN